MSSPLSRAAAVAALCAVPFLGFAQMRGSTPPGPASPPPGPGNTQSEPAAPSGKADTGKASNTTATTTATAPVTAGLTVKDNKGVSIGQISEVKADASGTQMATIKMGADSFQVPTSNLAVQDGAAVINLTQAQITSQLHKPKS